MSFPAILCPSAACVRKLSFGFFFFKNINCPLARATAGAGSTNQPINQHFEFFIIGGRGERERERERERGGKRKRRERKQRDFSFLFTNFHLLLLVSQFGVWGRENECFFYMCARVNRVRDRERAIKRESSSI